MTHAYDTDELAVLLARGLIHDDTVVFCRNGTDRIEVMTVAERLGLEHPEVYTLVDLEVPA